jgi:hypothetical protein
MDVRQRRMAAARLPDRALGPVSGARASSESSSVSDRIARSRMDVREWWMAPARISWRGGRSPNAGVARTKRAAADSRRLSDAVAGIGMDVCERRLGPAGLPRYAGGVSSGGLSTGGNLRPAVRCRAV